MAAAPQTMQDTRATGTNGNGALGSTDSNTVTVAIPAASEKDGVVYYEIRIHTPLKSYTLDKRFNDFHVLKQNLEILRMNHTLPYALPSKYAIWPKGDQLVESRRVQLEKFLQNVVSDGSLQSHPLVLEFLQLPKAVFEDQGDSSVRDVWSGTRPAQVDMDDWLPVLGKVTRARRIIAGKLGHDSIDPAEARTQMVNVRNELDNLGKSLAAGEKSIGMGEFKRRSALLAQEKKAFQDLESFHRDKLARRTPASAPASAPQRQELFSSSSRVLGKPRETSKTLPLNNEELFQQQQLQLQQQDQDIDHIRTIVQRQRQIATVIHNEVNEQNELLDDLSNDVDDSTDKMRTAKRMIRKIR